MELLTKELEAQFPRLYETEGKDPQEIKIIAKFFLPLFAVDVVRHRIRPCRPYFLWLCPRARE